MGYGCRKRSLSELHQFANSEGLSVQRNAWLSLVRNRLSAVIKLARPSLSLDGFFHVHSCILAGMLSGGILISSSDSLDNQFVSFRSTSRRFVTQSGVGSVNEERNGSDKRIFN